MAARAFWRRVRRDYGPYLPLSPYLFAVLFPFYWMVITTFKRDNDLYNLTGSPFWFKEPPTLSHVQLLLHDTLFLTWLWNSLLVGAAVVVITLAMGLPAAYGLVRIRFPGNETGSSAMFLSYLIPPTLLFLPLSRVIADLGLQNTLWALMLVYPSFTIPFSTWLLMGFFKTIPQELEDAALVDGCSRLRALRRIVFPLSLPGILTVVIFSFSLCVNEFIYAFTFISSSQNRTISAGVPNELIRGDVFFWQSLMAATLIPSIPLALLYNSFLDRFIKGFTGGAFR
jgi:multiple sugar transport system permease protein